MRPASAACNAFPRVDLLIPSYARWAILCAALGLGTSYSSTVSVLVGPVHETVLIMSQLLVMADKCLTRTATNSMSLTRVRPLVSSSITYNAHRQPEIKTCDDQSVVDDVRACSVCIS